jgi:O-antigen ligase
MAGVLGTGLGTYIPLFLYLGIILVSLASILWKPQLGLYLLILIVPLQTTREKLLNYPLGAEAIYILWFAVFLGLFFHNQGRIFPRSQVNRILLLLGVVTYISLWQGWLYLGGSSPINPSDQRFSDWRSYMLMPAIALVTAAALRDRKQLKFAVLLMIVVGCLVDWSFFRSGAGRDFTHYSEAVRDAGTLGYAGANGFSAFVAESVVFCASLFYFLREKWIRISLSVVMAFSVYCLLFSFSRGGYAACLIGLGFLALYRQRLLLIGLVVLVIAWQVILPTAVQERVTMTYDQEGQSLDASAAERVDLWQDAVTLISASPILGTGFDTYQFMHRIGTFQDTHNYYVKVLVEMGAIGLLLLLMVLWQMWRSGLRLYRASHDPFLSGLGFGFAAMIVTAAVANLFGDRWTYLQVDGPMWMLLGCVIRGQTIAEQELEAEKPCNDAARVNSLRRDPVAVS